MRNGHIGLFSATLVLAALTSMIGMTNDLHLRRWLAGIVMLNQILGNYMEWYALPMQQTWNTAERVLSKLNNDMLRELPTKVMIAQNQDMDARLFDDFVCMIEGAYATAASSFANSLLAKSSMTLVSKVKKEKGKGGEGDEETGK